MPACMHARDIQERGLRYYDLGVGARALASLGTSQTCVSNCIQSVHHPHRSKPLRKIGREEGAMPVIIFQSLSKSLLRLLPREIMQQSATIHETNRKQWGQRATMEPIVSTEQTMNDDSDDDNVKMPALNMQASSGTKASASITNIKSDQNNTNMLLQSEESMYEMMDDGNEQLPPDHYLLHNDWSPPEMSIDDFPPMPPLPPNDFLPMSPLPPMQMPPLLVQSTTETTPPIPQTFSNLSFEGESTKLNTYSPSLDEFLPADNNMHHFDHSTVGDVQSDRNVPSLGISHPSSVCLPSLDEHHEYFPSTFGNNEPSTQYFSGSNAMQEAIYSTPTTTYASLQNTTDANLYENAFSLTEAEMADDIAPGVYATTTAPLLSPSVEEDDRWSQKFKDLQEYKAKHGNCDVKQTEGKLGYWVNKVSARVLEWCVSPVLTEPSGL